MPVDSDKQVVDLLRSGRAETQADLCRLTGKNSSTVTYILKRLQDKGVLHAVGTRVSGPGRPGVLLKFDPGGFLAGVDIDLTRAIVGLTDFNGRLIVQEGFDLRHDATPQQVFAAARQRLEKLLKRERAKMSDVHGVGVGVRGHPTPEGVVHHSVGASWRDVPLREIASKAFGLPVFISRGEYRAVAEYRHSPGSPPAACMLLFNVADGVSSRPVLNGNLYSGGSGLTGEVGHVVVQSNGPLCTCGRRGCLEALVSGPAICRRIVAESETLQDVSPGMYDVLVRLATEGSAATAVTELIRLAEGGSAEYANQLLDQVIDLAAQGLAMSVACFGPDRIVVDGYVFRDRPKLLERLGNATKLLLGLEAEAMCRLESSSLGESARIMALGLLVADALVREGKIAG